MGKLSKAQQGREELAQEISQEAKRRTTVNKNDPKSANLQTEFISGQDLADIDKRLAKIDEVLRDYKGSNPQVYYELSDLISQFKSAKNSFLSHNKAIEDMLNGNFKPNYKVAGALFQTGKDIDEFSKEYLNRMVENYKGFIKNSLAEYLVKNEEVIQDDWTDSEIKNYIASKVKERKALTPKEREYYNNHQFEINELARPNPNKPNFGKKRDEFTQLAAAKVNNTLTEEQEERYKNLSAEEKDLVQKTINFTMQTQEAVKRANELQKKLNELESSQDRKNLSKIKEEILS
jgi:hypothetical protein